MKILIVEDDLNIARQLSEHLRSCGFVTHVVSNGEEGKYRGEVEDYDAVLLDVGLPDIDGFTILEHWRAIGRTMLVIILSARTRKMETIQGLESGADDYIYKPFDLDEVVARLQTHIRRQKGHLQKNARCKNVDVDFSSGRVLLDGVAIKLTRIEFLMVQYLFLNQGRRITISELSEHVYEDFDHDSSVIPRHIANIRKKIGHDIILTESNRGYYVPENEI